MEDVEDTLLERVTRLTLEGDGMAAQDIATTLEVELETVHSILLSEEGRARLEALTQELASAEKPSAPDSADRMAVREAAWEQMVSKAFAPGTPSREKKEYLTLVLKQCEAELGAVPKGVDIVFDDNLWEAMVNDLDRALKAKDIEVLRSYEQLVEDCRRVLEAKV